MKKKLSLILALMLIMLTGCGDTAEVPEPEELSVFFSENGYSVSYPAGYSPSALSGDIDFVVMDEISGTTVTILTAETDGAGDITEAQFEAEKSAEGMDIDVLTFEQKTINEIPALEVTYEYNESLVTEIIYTAESSVYRATYTELPGTSSDVRAEMTAIINSLTV